MKKVLVVALSMAFALAGAGFLVADDKEGAACCGAGKSETALKCPISGGAVSKEAAVDYKGGKVQFCCPGCIPKFKESTAKYQAKANEQLVLSGQFKQVGCPLSGGKLNPSTKIKVCGIDVCFCCKNCQGKVAKADAQKQCEMVFVKGFDKAFALKKETKKEEK
jgi:YHS domain-containing protein